MGRREILIANVIPLRKSVNVCGLNWTNNYSLKITQNERTCNPSCQNHWQREWESKNTVRIAHVLYRFSFCLNSLVMHWSMLKLTEFANDLQSAWKFSVFWAGWTMNKARLPARFMRQKGSIMDNESKSGVRTSFVLFTFAFVGIILGNIWIHFLPPPPSNNYVGIAG